MNESKLFNFVAVLFEVTKYALLILVVVTVIVMLVATPLLVRGDSMLPNFHSGEAVLVEKISGSRQSDLQRGDVVAARFPADPEKTRLIKRVIGLPGETIRAENGVIFVNGIRLNETYNPRVGEIPYNELKEVTLGTGQYYLVGDNRPGSSDSRLWGSVERKDILGKVLFVIFPPKALHFVDTPIY